MTVNEHSFIKEPSDEQRGVLRYCGKIVAQFAPNGVRGQFVFKCTAGMWVERTFIDVLGGSVSFEAGSIEVKKYQLQKKTNNQDILLSIGTDGIYRGEEGKELLKRIIASGIITQWRGGPGLFLTDVQNNIFYFEQYKVQYAIQVFRMTIVPEWNLNMWRVADDLWSAGDVVYTPAIG